MKDVFKFLEEQNENFDHLLDEITEEDIDIAIEETFEEEVKNEGIIDRMLAGRNKEGSKKWVTKKPETQEGRKNKLGPRTKQSDPYESNEAFKSHMMYDPKTGKGYKAEKEEDHLRMKKMGYTHVKESVQIFEATDFKSTFDSLKKGDTVKIKYGSSISRQQEGTFKVTFKSVVGKAKVGKITLVKQGEGAAKVKHYLYDRNGKVSMAMGDMGASMTSLVKESVELDEGIVTKTLTGLVDKGLNKVLDKLEKMTGKHLGLVQKSKIPSTGKDKANNVLNYIGTPKFHDAKKLKKESEDFHRKAKKQWTWSKREVGDSFRYYGDGKIPKEQREMVSDLQAEMQKIIDMHTQLEKMMQTTGNSVKYQRTMEKLESDTNRVFEEIGKVTERGDARYRAAQGIANLKKAKKMTHGELKKGSSVKFRSYANRGESVDEGFMDTMKQLVPGAKGKPVKGKPAKKLNAEQVKISKQIDKKLKLVDSLIQKVKPLGGQISGLMRFSKLPLEKMTPKDLYRVLNDWYKSVEDELDYGNDSVVLSKKYGRSVENLYERMEELALKIKDYMYASGYDVPHGGAKFQNKWLNKVDFSAPKRTDAKWLKMNESVNEKKNSQSNYDLYHSSFSGAMQHAYKHAKDAHGITVHSSEIDDKVASGPRKPVNGKTNSYRLKGDKGNIQVQVYNRGGSKPFELNMYKESVIEDAEMIIENVSPKQIAMLKKQYSSMPDRLPLDQAMKMSKMIAKFDKASLMKVAKADIKWLSSAAKTNLISKHGATAKDFKEDMSVHGAPSHSADKKPQNYRKPDGKMGVKMVPMDPQTTRKEEASNYVSEKLKPSDGMAAYIKDFAKSDAPSLKGKDEKKRKEMAIAAYVYAKSRARD